MAFPLFTTRMYKVLSYKWANTLFGCFAVLLLPIPYVCFQVPCSYLRLLKSGCRSFSSMDQLSESEAGSHALSWTSHEKLETSCAIRFNYTLLFFFYSYNHYYNLHITSLRWYIMHQLLDGVLVLKQIHVIIMHWGSIIGSLSYFYPDLCKLEHHLQTLAIFLSCTNVTRKKKNHWNILLFDRVSPWIAFIVISDNSSPGCLRHFPRISRVIRSMVTALPCLTDPVANHIPCPFGTAPPRWWNEYHGAQAWIRSGGCILPLSFFWSCPQGFTLPP